MFWLAERHFVWHELCHARGSPKIVFTSWRLCHFGWDVHEAFGATFLTKNSCFRSFSIMENFRNILGKDFWRLAVSWLVFCVKFCASFRYLILQTSSRGSDFCSRERSWNAWETRRNKPMVFCWKRHRLFCLKRFKGYRISVSDQSPCLSFYYWSKWSEWLASSISVLFWQTFSFVLTNFFLVRLLHIHLSFQ